MSLPTNIGAYDDCFRLFDRAVADTTGVRALFVDKPKAMTFQMRLHQARSLDREEAKRIYSRDAPQWGRSEYDKLIVQVLEDTDGNWWVYIKQRGDEIVEVESLSEIEDGA